MAQQVSMEAALAAYRRRCGELFTANVLLEARVEDLEREVAAQRGQGTQVADEVPAGPELGEHEDR